MKEKISWFNEIPAKVFFVLSVTGIFYFYGGDLVRYKLKDDWQQIAYVIVLFSVAITLTNFLVYTWKLFTKWNSIRLQKKDYKRILIDLDRLERAVLREFYVQRKSILSLKYDQAVIQGLVDKNVLINASSIYGAIIIDGDTATYKINAYIKSIIDPAKDLQLNEYLEFVARTR